MVAMKILSCLIYQRKSNDLRDIWVENIGDNIVYFVTISTVRAIMILEDNR